MRKHSACYAVVHPFAAGRQPHDRTRQANARRSDRADEFERVDRLGRCQRRAFEAHCQSPELPLSSMASYI